MNETMLDVVRQLLNKRRTDFGKIAADCGIGKNTVYRIADNPEYDPGFSKVQSLYNYLVKAS